LHFSRQIPFAVSLIRELVCQWLSFLEHKAKAKTSEALVKLMGYKVCDGQTSALRA
jgi:hypothetical protein